MSDTSVFKPRFTSQDARVLTVVMTVGLAARLAAALILPDQSAHLPDVIAYRNMAHDLWTRGHTDYVYAMPLYPLLVGLVGAGWGQIGMDILLSVMSIGLVYFIARLLFEVRTVAALASAGVALYPPLIFYSVVGLSETLFIFLILGSLAAWYYEKFVTGSIFAILAILTRPIYDLIAPVLLVYFAIVIYRLSVLRTGRQLVIYVLLYCALMAPWWLHNYAAYGTFVRLYPALGNALYAGNNPMNKTGGGNLGVDYDRTPFEHIADPVKRQDAMRSAAIDFIKNNPGRFVELAGLKFLRFWRLWPQYEGYASPLYILIAVGSLAPILLLSIVKLMFFSRAMFARLGPILIFAVYMTLVHMVILGTTRYRLPIEPFMIIFSASALVDLYGRSTWTRMRDFADAIGVLHIGRPRRQDS